MQHTHIANALELENPSSQNWPGQELRWPASMIWRRGEPIVRTIGVADLKDAFWRGYDDFIAVPSHAAFLFFLYPVIGIVLSRVLFGYALLPLAFPLAAGFALIGPVAAVGLYELSRRREQGLDVSVWNLTDVLKAPSLGAIVRLSVVLFALFAAWMMTANLIYQQTMGTEAPTSVSAFLTDVMRTEQGHKLMFAGNAVGFVFALVAAVISVVSFPMLVDRNVSAATAVRTSVRAVLHNPVVMALWGLFVAATLVLGMVPLFLGLAIILPVLGHATWHLYRKIVSQDEVLNDFGA